MLFGPRWVPATSSCSEATATISPTGDSSLPAVERTSAGDAADRLDRVVVPVLVGHQQEVGVDVPDRRVVEAQAARGERARVACRTGR